MSHRSRGWSLTVGALVLAASLAACGDSSDQAATTPPPPTTAASPAPTGGPAATPATVATASSDLGTILVDGAGMTLYLYTKDTQGSGKSTCEGECLAAWPPLVGKPTAGTGADPSLLGSLTRTDGSIQGTYNGWPLYYWVEDHAPGDTTGQDVGGVWYVLDAKGDPIE